MRETITVPTSANQYRHLHRPDCRKTQNYAHETSRTDTNCDISTGSLNLPAPEAGIFEELLLLRNTSDIRHTHHLSSLKHITAVIKAIMCNSSRLFVLNIWGSCVSVKFRKRLFLFISWIHFVNLVNLAYLFVNWK